MAHEPLNLTLRTSCVNWFTWLHVVDLTEKFHWNGQLNLLCTIFFGLTPLSVGQSIDRFAHKCQMPADWQVIRVVTSLHKNSVPYILPFESKAWTRKQNQTHFQLKTENSMHFWTHMNVTNASNFVTKLRGSDARSLAAIPGNVEWHRNWDMTKNRRHSELSYNVRRTAVPVNDALPLMHEPYKITLPNMINSKLLPKFPRRLRSQHWWKTTIHHSNCYYQTLFQLGLSRNVCKSYK